MKVVLAALNAKFTHSSLALRYLTKAASAFNIEAVEYNINQDLAQITADLSARQPDILGFSCYIWNITQVLQIVSDLRRVHPQLTVVLGGPEVSFDTDYWLNAHPDVDFVIAGEGEKAWPAFLSAWQAGGGALGLDQLRSIPGLAFRWDGKVCQNPSAYVDLGTVPAAYDEVDGLENRIVYYETTLVARFAVLTACHRSWVQYGSFRWTAAERN